MTEIYTLHLEQDRLCFTQEKANLPQCVLSDKFVPESGEKDIYVACRMGDPDLLQCIVFRREKESGGYFALRDKSGLLYAAMAANQLVYSLALGYFGNLTANARYGVDVFENLEEPDD